jgi:exosortase/archaeosortase family protein
VPSLPDRQPPEDFHALATAKRFLSSQVAIVVGGMISWVDVSPTVVGATILTPSGPWEVVPGCLGLIYGWLGTVAVLSLPIPWGRRLGGIAALAVLTQFLNLIRLLTQYLLWEARYLDLAETLHRGTGFFFTLVVTLCFWSLLWIQRGRVKTGEPEKSSPEIPVGSTPG